jgi:hypothetical protein
VLAYVCVSVQAGHCTNQRLAWPAKVRTGENLRPVAEAQTEWRARPKLLALTLLAIASLGGEHKKMHFSSSVTFCILFPQNSLFFP